MSHVAQFGAMSFARELVALVLIGGGFELLIFWCFEDGDCSVQRCHCSKRQVLALQRNLAHLSVYVRPVISTRI